MNIAIIPNNYFLPQTHLKTKELDPRRLKAASGEGGVLDRWKSPKTRRVFYRSRNLNLFQGGE